MKDAFGVERISKKWDVGEKSQSGSKGVYDNTMYNKRTHEATRKLATRNAVGSAALGGTFGSLLGLATGGRKGALIGGVGSAALSGGLSYGATHHRLKSQFAKPMGRFGVERGTVARVANSYNQNAVKQSLKTGQPVKGTARINMDKWGSPPPGISKAFGLKPAAKVLGHGPGARLAPGASLKLKPKPAAEYKGFVEYDPLKRAQQQRAAVKGTFR
jgi:hypothetical protein